MACWKRALPSKAIATLTVVAVPVSEAVPFVAVQGAATVNDDPVGAGVAVTCPMQRFRATPIVLVRPANSTHCPATKLFDPVTVTTWAAMLFCVVPDFCGNAAEYTEPLVCEFVATVMAVTLTTVPTAEELPCQVRDGC